jgi:hypothetical protein
MVSRLIMFPKCTTHHPRRDLFFGANQASVTALSMMCR